MSEEMETLTGAEESTEEVVEETREDTGEPTYPDGANVDNYDLYKQEWKTSAMLEQLKAKDDEIANVSKQRDDMRSIIAKGKNAPQDIEGYTQGYEPSEEYERFYNFEDEGNAEIKENFEKFASIAKEASMSKEQFEAMINGINEFAREQGLLDTRTAEQIALEQQDFINSEKAKLHEDPVKAQSIIKSNVDWVKNATIFNEEEKNAIIGMMNNGAIGISVMNKIRQGFGLGGGSIPVNDVNTDGLASDTQLAREYYNKETTQERRIEILQKRRDAGREGSLPLAS